MGQYRLFLVLLLATASFALPRMKREVSSGNDFLDTVVDKMTDGTGIQKEIVETAKKTGDRIDKLMKEVESRLVTLSAEIGVLNIDKIAVTREAIESYRNVKDTLRTTRNELKRLAHKTILTTNDLVIYMQAWDKSHSVSDQKEYLKEQITIMRQLLSDSKSILANAKTTYDEAAKEIDTVNQKLESFKRAMDQMLDKNSAEHKAWTKSIRAGVYGAAGGTTGMMLILDFMGCAGLCTAIGTTSTWTASIAAVESEIAKVTAKIEELEETVKNALEATEEIGTFSQGLQNFIQHEIITILKWDNTVDHMYANIEKVKEESFYRLHLKRTVFTNAVKGLRTAATDFLDQPDGIFGEEPLKRELENEAEKQKNYQAILDVAENIRKYNIKFS